MLLSLRQFLNEQLTTLIFFSWNLMCFQKLQTAPSIFYDLRAKTAYAPAKQPDVDKYVSIFRTF